MKKSSRRSFMKILGGAVPVLALGRSRNGVAPSSDAAHEEEPTLTALAEVVLPTKALGADGLAVALAGFVSWRDGLTPGAELDHAYLSTDDLQFAPADRRPQWASQLEALDRRAQREDGEVFAELGLEQRRRLLDLEWGEPPERMPHAAEAGHISLAIIAWYFATPAANDLCYGARIGRHACRGLPTAPDEPTPFLAADIAEPGR